MSHFQVELAGKWEDYKGEEDKMLKRAFLSGFPSAKYKFRGQTYIYDFNNKTQTNEQSGKKRSIRPPTKLKRPAAPISGGGKSKFVKVPPGKAGEVIYVKHPEHKGEKFPVTVPATGGAGGAMLVTVPEKEKKGGWSTGARVAAGATAGGAAAVGVAGAAIGGVMLADHLAGGDEGMIGDLADGIEDVAGDIADGAEEAVDWVGDAGGDVGDFFMDLF